MSPYFCNAVITDCAFIDLLRYADEWPFLSISEVAFEGRESLTYSRAHICGQKITIVGDFSAGILVIMLSRLLMSDEWDNAHQRAHKSLVQLSI